MQAYTTEVNSHPMEAERREAFVKQARECLKNGQFQEAASFAEQAAELDSKNPDAYMILGAALSKAERPDEAADAFRHALQINPNSAKAHYNLAVHFYRYGWRTEASREAAKARELDGGHQPTKALIQRIENEARTPELKVYMPGSPMVAPPVTGLGPERSVPSWVASDFYVPNAGALDQFIPFVARLGRWWDGLMLALILVMVMISVISRDSVMTAVVFTLFLAATITDLMNRRPGWAQLCLAGLALVLLIPPEHSPLAFILVTSWRFHEGWFMVLPVAGGVLGLVYLFSSRLKIE